MLSAEFEQYRSATASIAALLEASERIIVTCHVRPDGDAIGSLLGLHGMLRAIGKQPRLIIPSPVPPTLRFLPNSDMIECYDADRHDGIIAEAEIIVYLDFNTTSRLEQMGAMVRMSPARRILIDHHLEPEEGFAAMLHDTEVASTAELVFALLWLQYPQTLSRETSIPLYAGILTDTGNFRFPRVTPRTHRIVATLIEQGVEPHQIYEALYDTNTPARLRLMGEVLRRLEVVCNGECAILAMPWQLVLQTGATEEDAEGFVQYTLTIQGVRIGAFLSELPNCQGVKVSLRSKGSVNIQRIAELLGGGGHLNAAGATIIGKTLDQVKEELVQLFAERLDKDGSNVP